MFHATIVCEIRGRNLGFNGESCLGGGSKKDPQPKTRPFFDPSLTVIAIVTMIWRLTSDSKGIIIQRASIRRTVLDEAAC